MTSFIQSHISYLERRKDALSSTPIGREACERQVALLLHIQSKLDSGIPLTDYDRKVLKHSEACVVEFGASTDGVEEKEVAAAPLPTSNTTLNQSKTTQSQSTSNSRTYSRTRKPQKMDELFSPIPYKPQLRAVEAPKAFNRREVREIVQGNYRESHVGKLHCPQYYVEQKLAALQGSADMSGGSPLSGSKRLDEKLHKDQSVKISRAVVQAESLRKHAHHYPHHLPAIQQQPTATLPAPEDPHEVLMAQLAGLQPKWPNKHTTVATTTEGGCRPLFHHPPLNDKLTTPHNNDNTEEGEANGSNGEVGVTTSINIKWHIPPWLGGVQLFPVAQLKPVAETPRPEKVSAKTTDRRVSVVNSKFNSNSSNNGTPLRRGSNNKYSDHISRTPSGVTLPHTPTPPSSSLGEKESVSSNTINHHTNSIFGTKPNGSRVRHPSIQHRPSLFAALSPPAGDLDVNSQFGVRSSPSHPYLRTQQPAQPQRQAQDDSSSEDDEEEQQARRRRRTSSTPWSGPDADAEQKFYEMLNKRKSLASNETDKSTFTQPKQNTKLDDDADEEEEEFDEEEEEEETDHNQTQDPKETGEDQEANTKAGYEPLTDIHSHGSSEKTSSTEEEGSGGGAQQVGHQPQHVAQYPLHAPPLHLQYESIDQLHACLAPTTHTPSTHITLHHQLQHAATNVSNSSAAQVTQLIAEQSAEINMNHVAAEELGTFKQPAAPAAPPDRPVFKPSSQ